MKLKWIKFNESEGTAKEWVLEKTELSSINLIVGRNASGKTRFMKIINYLSVLFLGGKITGSYVYDVCFEKENDKIIYFLVIKNNKVIVENLTKNGKKLLTRVEGGKGQIYAKELNKNMNFHAPEDQLACVNRRDQVQHPFFEDLYLWAKSVVLYEFASSLGRDIFKFPSENYATEANLKNTHDVIDIFQRGVKEYSNFESTIINDMKKIGYKLEKIGTDTVKTGLIMNGNDPEGLWVKETDLKGKTEQIGMSQGMFRAFSLIIQLNFSKLIKQNSCIIIDDIGEGLDYERSSALIKLLIEKIDTDRTQLIMSTNNRFIMNNIPLEHWCIIKRISGKSKIFNYKNSHEIFDNFSFTGLSNFDFFTSSFYDEFSSYEKDKMKT